MNEKKFMEYLLSLKKIMDDSYMKEEQAKETVIRFYRYTEDFLYNENFSDDDIDSFLK